MNYSFCSDGTRISEAGIRARYSDALREKHAGNPPPMCEGCLKERAVDNSHVIARAECKCLHKTELIWHLENFFNACRKCHHIWENFKSGEFIHLANLAKIMAFMKEHDPAGFNKRMVVLNELYGE